MATIKFKKGDEYLLRLSKLADKTVAEVCGQAIYVAMNGYDGLYEDLIKHMKGLAGGGNGNS